MESSSPELSPDMIFQVLSRTSLQTLDSSRTVCKDWNNLTYDPYFTHIHGRNRNIVSGYLVQSLVSNKHKLQFVSINGSQHCNNLSFEFLHAEKMKIEASSDQGLFVCVSSENHRHHRYYICKPSTKQLVALPNPKTRYLTQKIALMVLAAKPLHYKIIRLSWPIQGVIGYVEYKSELFDSATRAWKETKPVLLSYGEFLTAWYPAICARGSVYFLTDKDRVLAFQENSESYNLFLLPKPAYENPNYKHKRIVKYKGRLGFTCKAPNGHLELWIMKKQRWKKKMVLASQVLEEKEDYPVLGGFCNSGVALVKGDRSVIFYDVRSSNLYQERLEHKPDQLFAFRSDFEPTYFNGRY